MKVGLVSDSLSTSAGGIFEIERSLARELRGLGVEVSAWGIRDEHWDKVADQWEGIECHVRERLGPRIFGYAPGLVRDLVGSGCDLLHLQHLWMYPSLAVHQWHRRTGRPYLVTANGMLEPWTLGNSRLNKRLAAWCYEDRMLRAAACLQANTAKEAADFRSYGLTNPVCIIPNGVDLPADDLSTDDGGGRPGPRVLLFLGRLHPKKGLVNALRAWAAVNGRGARETGWRFVVAGWDQGGHGDELKRLCRELGISVPEDAKGDAAAGSVVFQGAVYGGEKDALLRQADAFILPSFSEGLPMAVLEAWSYHLPVVMTDPCNLPEGFAAGAALRVETGVESIVSGLRDLFDMTDDQRSGMGAAGRALVEAQFTWPKVAAQMKEVHEWLLGGGMKPGCVAERGAGSASRRGKR